jgi:ATP-binding cassette subfamily B protein
MFSVNPAATNPMLVESMKMACISGLLDNSEEGFNKMIGEKGINLSGGQKQRMALARLLLKNPDLFILDDITSYIDELNEQSILMSLKKIMADRTCIIISHKLSSILFADKIIALNYGSLEQTGTQESLININGYFNVIFNLQTEGKPAEINES